jgi:hypothetical protein
MIVNLNHQPHRHKSVSPINLGILFVPQQVRKFKFHIKIRSGIKKCCFSGSMGC